MNDLVRGDAGARKLEDLSNPADRSHRARARARPVIFVGHDPDLVRRGTDRRPVLRLRTAPGTRLARLRIHVDRQEFPCGVESIRQLPDEHGERRPIPGWQVLVVQVDAVVPPTHGKLHQRPHIHVAQPRAVDDPAHRRAVPLAIDDVGDGGDDEDAVRSEERDHRRVFVCRTRRCGVRYHASVRQDAVPEGADLREDVEVRGNRLEAASLVPEDEIPTHPFLQRRLQRATGRCSDDKHEGHAEDGSSPSRPSVYHLHVRYGVLRGNRPAAAAAGYN